MATCSIPLGNALVFINGIVSSSYIGCFAPSVIDYITTSSSQCKSEHHSNYLVISSFILGISNLMTLSGLGSKQPSSTVNQLKNACSLGVILAANILNAKYHKYSNANSKKYCYFNVALYSFLLVSCMKRLYNKQKASTSEPIRNVSHLLQQMRKDNIQYVRFEVTSISGQPIGMVVPARNCERFLRKGFPFVPLALPSTANNSLDVIEHFGNTGFRNVDMFVDVTSYKVIPWQTQNKTASLTMAQDDSANDIYPIDCRTLALRLLSKLHDTYQLDLFASVEHEFYLLDSDNKPVSSAGCYKMDRMNACHDLFCKIDQYLYAMGINCERLHSEVSSGQYEITALPAYNIKSADDAFWIRNGLREICELHSDWIATFVTHLPKASDAEFSTVEDDNNGSHFNHSLCVRNGGKGQNVLWDADKNEVSQLGLYWIGGILKHIASITALCCPTTICYESRWESPWVSSYGDWAFRDRTVLFRVKPSANNTHFELRLPSGLANPYLVLSSVLCAGMIGIQNKILPPKRRRNDVMKQSDDACYSTELPKTLSDALNALEKDKDFVANMDELLIDTYIKTKRIEIQEMKGFEQRKQTPLLYSLF
eukprot:945873_1